MLISFTLNRKGLDYRRNGIDSSFYRDIRIINDFVRKDYFNSPSKQTEPYYQASSELYNFLLGGYQFEENSRLIIVPDGMLTFIPFDILITKPVEGKDHNYGDLDWLIRKYTLSYAYSATLLFQKGPHRLTAGKSMIAFAPFEPGTDINEKDTTRYIPAGRVKLKPLAGSAEEVRAIAGLTGGEVRIGSEASEYGFKKLSPPYRILHLAAHTFINEDDPLHSTLIFSASDEGKEDGMLNVSEIYNLDLKARMVVLSACNTGTGMLKRGEGIMSLARAFFYAGVPSVVMTLWPVSDESCVTLMAAFYQNLMRGESKDAALRNAKLLLIMEAEPIFKHPFYWAGYIVVGERSPVFLPRNKIYFTAGLILAISVTVILFRRRIFRKVRPAENSTD
jgi:CHAT domain-containing protein